MAAGYLHKICDSPPTCPIVPWPNIVASFVAEHENSIDHMSSLHWWRDACAYNNRYITWCSCGADTGSAFIRPGHVRVRVGCSLPPSPFGSSHTIARNFISICVFLIVNNERLVLVTSQHRPLRHPLISLPAHPPLPPDPFLVLIVSTGFPSGILINSCNVARGDNEINDNRSVIKCKYPSNVWHSPFISLLWRSTSNNPSRS